MYNFLYGRICGELARDSDRPGKNKDVFAGSREMAEIETFLRKHLRKNERRRCVVECDFGEGRVLPCVGLRDHLGTATGVDSAFSSEFVLNRVSPTK
jgi:hypothetical protein